MASEFRNYGKLIRPNHVTIILLHQDMAQRSARQCHPGNQSQAFLIDECLCIRDVNTIGHEDHIGATKTQVCDILFLFLVLVQHLQLSARPSASLLPWAAKISLLSVFVVFNLWLGHWALALFTRCLAVCSVVFALLYGVLAFSCLCRSASCEIRLWLAGGLGQPSRHWEVPYRQPLWPSSVGTVKF